MAYDEIHNESEAQRRGVYDAALSERDLDLQIAGAEVARLTEENDALRDSADATAEELAAALIDAQQWQNAWTQATGLYNVLNQNFLALQGEHADTLADLDSTTIALAGVTSALTALQAEFDQYKLDHPDEDPDPDPDPDPEPETDQVFGASDGQWPIRGVDSLKGHRAYLGGGDLTGNTSWTGTSELSNAVARTRTGDTIWLSIKDNRPSDLARLLATKPARKIVVTYRHEPENDVQQPLSNSSKQADIASYQAAWAQLLPVIRNGGAKSATCLLGDRVAPNSPDNPESVAYHVEGVDYVGFDRYNPGLGNATSYTNPVTVLRPCVLYTQHRSSEDGKQYGLVLGEWGTIAVGSSSAGAGGDQAGRRQWAQGYVNECKAIHADPARPSLPVVLYWNQSRMAFNTDPTDELAQICLDLN